MDNKTNTTTSPSTTFQLSANEILAWCIGYATVDAFIIVGNTIAIVIFTKSKLLRKRTNYFLLTLSIADMLVGCVSLPMFIHHVSVMIDSNVSPLFNNIYLTLDIFTGFASIFALTIIALERLYAVALPNWHHTTLSSVYFVLIAVIWFLAGIFGILRMLFSYKYVIGDAFYNSTMAALFTSLVVICLAYICIAVKVRWRINEKTKKTIEKNRKLAVTLSIVTLIFVVTWLPFYLLNIVFRFCKPSNCPHKIDYNVVLFSKFLQYCNSFINPIIYSFKIPDFRVALLRLFGRNTLSRPSSTWISLKDTRKRSGNLRQENGNGTENGIFRKRIGSSETEA
ncbi:adenosine receptor A1 isoform X2 [Exaiptasia diaphana]|nr:adenosine receptor A1 isoform X2 [Exaiptasia diaphana]XP_020903939.1 adenosine receptor A1 isoform X2 [Exaiptasia diaphana]XP_020903940.1 adenosine receptor A1 isoform X2 [Exaiptasia diaphana]XP_020903941.1 adenosine receptor A1 isoform X2 [Exaiptasia diaphana]XP_020903942.1 adenosine receptor A1 isoform X2 [Exaiptasia diaphana]KXJ12345.1 Tachykinin-like peptides receptor 86C [Exaiptasia diaphana]